MREHSTGFPREIHRFIGSNPTTGTGLPFGRGAGRRCLDSSVLSACSARVPCQSLIQVARAPGLFLAVSVVVAANYTSPTEEQADGHKAKRKPV